MTRHSGIVDHPNRRLLVALPDSYERARERYETLVPAYDAAAFAAVSNWDEVLAVAKAQAPHGFLRYFQIDVAPAMVGSGSDGQATEYLMGNHTIAERMYRHDPSVMLHAPLRTLLYDGPRGTVLAVDQPSLLFASYGNPEITAVGQELDTLLVTLIGLLDGDVPAELAR
jgi:hypothetical protein